MGRGRVNDGARGAAAGNSPRPRKRPCSGRHQVPVAARAKRCEQTNASSRFGFSLLAYRLRPAALVAPPLVTHSSGTGGPLLCTTEPPLEWRQSCVPGLDLGGELRVPDGCEGGRQPCSLRLGRRRGLHDAQRLRTHRTLKEQEQVHAHALEADAIGEEESAARLAVWEA
eukprot:5923086-Pleurochrysis_carterae.AAC.1